MTARGASGAACLAILLVAAPAGAAEFVVCDNGIRCFRAPCPSRSAVDLTTRKLTRGVDIDLSGVPENERRDEKGPLRSGLYYGTGVVDAELVQNDRRMRIVIARYLRPATPAERRLCRPGR